MKIYNYKTKRLYEAESTIKLSLVEFDDEDKQIGGTKEFTDSYASIDEAIDDAEEIMRNIASREGIDEDDIEFEEDDDMITFTVPGFGKWVFTASPIVKECDNADQVEECDDTKEGCHEDEEISECGDVTEEEIDECGDKEEDDVKESVVERFMRMRKMFESEDEEKEETSEEEPEEKEENKDDTEEEETEDDDKKKEEENEEEDEEMKAVVITVKKGDEEKCKDEMVDAGIAEEDIEILDADDDAENVDIRIDVNSVLELKDYLAKKGIDLEEEIGGEIVSDEEVEDEDEEKETDKEEDSKEEGEDDDIDDFDFDKIGDIFGDEEE